VAGFGKACNQVHSPEGTNLRGDADATRDMAAHASDRSASDPLASDRQPSRLGQVQGAGVGRSRAEVNCGPVIHKAGILCGRVTPELTRLRVSHPLKPAPAEMQNTTCACEDI
jgi:hypothetical protein